MLVVLGQGLGNVVYFAAIKHLNNGTAQIAFSSILLFNTMLSIIFLGLKLSPVNIVGVFVLLFAITIVVTGKIEFHKRGTLLMLLAAFLFSIFQLASSELSKQVGAASYLIIAYLGASLVVFALKAPTVINDVRSAKNHTIFSLPFLTALPSLGNFLFAYYAYRSAPTAPKVAMLLTSQVVLTVLLSYFFLNEKGNLPRKFAAAILVVVSAILIKG